MNGKIESHDCSGYLEQTMTEHSVLNQGIYIALSNPQGTLQNKVYKKIKEQDLREAVVACPGPV